MNKLLIASGNQDKIQEIEELLADLELEILSPAQIGGIPEVIEDGQTLSENAIKKAREVHKATTLMTIADDTGLLVDALDGRPGVYSARYAGPNASYEDNNFQLLEELEGFEGEERRARFKTVIAFLDSAAEVHTVEGICEGYIAYQAQGENGFGYDPLFIPEGYQKTFAQLSAEEKNQISHRGRALLKMKDYLLNRF